VKGIFSFFSPYGANEVVVLVEARFRKSRPSSSRSPLQLKCRTMFRRSTFFGARDQLKKAAAAALQEIRDAGTFKNERVITSAQSSHITVSTSTAPVLNFCANNYLGLANHKEIISAAKKALDERGFGMGSVRFICGTQDIHKNLEKQITSFLGTQDTILYPSAFDANAGVFEALLNDQDAVISDSLNHASIIDGIRLCKAERYRYQHLDLAELETHLQKTQDKRVRLIVTDGVFSMDGDVAPLDKIVVLAEKYNANIFVDDCHATGFMGPGGRGTPALFGVQDKIDIVNGTLGKAMGGGSGGFSSGCAEIVSLQRNKGRPYLFSNSIPPPIVAGTTAAFQILSSSSDLQKRLQENTTLFRSKMKKAGFNVLGHDSCPIAPILLNDARVAATFAEKMLGQGIYVIAFSFPVVPKGQARIRVQLSASHSTEDVERAVTAFISIKKELGV
jgi:glycine C-acetyltransferase